MATKRKKKPAPTLPTPARQYVVHLPALDKSVSVHAYLTALKTAMANPDVTFKQSFEGWWPATGAEIVSQWWGMVVETRINRGLPTTGKGNRAKKRVRKMGTLARIRMGV